MFKPEAPRMTKQRSMLVFDSAYTYKMIEERGLHAIITGKDLNGFFDQVWTVHAMAGLQASKTSRDYGRPLTHRLTTKHFFIEGRRGRFHLLRYCHPLNFLLGQVDLFFYLLSIAFANRITLVRSEDPLYHGFFAFLIGKILIIPFLVGVWGNPRNIRRSTGKPLMPRLFPHPAIEVLLEYFILHQASLVMTQNYDNAAYVLSRGIPRSRIKIFRLTNLLDEVHFVKPSSRPSSSDDLQEFVDYPRPFVLVVSRLQELKLVHHVVLAAGLLKSWGLTPTFILAGDGPYKDDLRELAKSQDVFSQIIMCGNKSQSWLSRVMPSVDAVAVPLAGRGLAEVAFAGAPVVAYDVDWHSELIVNRQTGMLAPYMDYHTFASDLKFLLSNPISAKQMGVSLRERAISKLDPLIADLRQAKMLRQLLK